MPGRSSDIRSQFELFCDSHGIRPSICAEVDDMAILRLLARDSGDVALLPAVVVQGELQAGVLELYAQIPEIAEQFFAVTPQRHFNLAVLDELLSAH